MLNLGKKSRSNGQIQSMIVDVRCDCGCKDFKVKLWIAYGNLSQAQLKCTSCGTRIGPKG